MGIQDGRRNPSVGARHRRRYGEVRFLPLHPKLTIKTKTMQGVITSRETTGQTAAEILAEAKNINSPDNTFSGLVEVTIDGKTIVGTRDKLTEYFIDHIK